MIPRDGIPDRALFKGKRRSAHVYSGAHGAKTKQVDYNNPGPVIVYLDSGASIASGGPDAALEIRRVAKRVTLTPPLAVCRRGAAFSVHNADTKPHVLYWVWEGGSAQAMLESDDTTRIAISSNGPATLYALTAEGLEASLFVAGTHYQHLQRPGPFALKDVPPGDHELRAWHARFPPTEHRLSVLAGKQTVINLKISVNSLPKVE